MEANSDRIESFRALALQVTCHAINHVQNRTEARSAIAQAIQPSLQSRDERGFNSLTQNPFHGEL